MTRLALLASATLAALAMPAVVLAAAPAAPASVSYSSNVIALQDTDWDDQLTLQKYQGSAALTGVTVELFGSVAGSLLAESTDSQAASLTLKLASTITLALPTTGNGTLSVTPLYAKTVQAAAFDGVEDFAGTSGFAFDITTPVTGHASASFSDAASLAAFTGPGLLTLALAARDGSLTTGAANYADAYSSQAGAFARVTYTYAAAPVPEPGTWALMMAGIGMVGMLASRRRSR